MSKELIKRFLPDAEKIRNQKSLKIFGSLLHNVNLWSLNRRSASGAFAVGLFMAFMPIPIQMFIAASLAILFKVHLPLSVGLVWVTNPVTMPFIFYGTYKVGATIMHTPPHPFHFQLSWEFLLRQMHHIGPPFMLGCVVCGAIAAMIGYFGVRILWRYQVARSWQRRSLKARKRKARSEV